MKTHIFIDAYDDDGTQKCYIYNGPIQNLRPQAFFDKIFLVLNSKSATYISADKITHIKAEDNDQENFRVPL